MELVDFFYGTGLCRLEEDVLSLSLEESGELGSNGGGLNPVSSEPVEGLGGGFGKIFKVRSHSDQVSGEGRHAHIVDTSGFGLWPYI